MSAPIATERVDFPAGANTLVGNLHRPVDTPAGPAVVVTGSWTTVKEQMADRYARLLAAQGFAALAFDFTGFGESAGEPRDIESPALKALDIGHAVTFLTEHPAVDPARIGALAICASAGYTTLNVVDDDRVRCLALIAPWLHDAALVREMYGGENGVAERVQAGHAARRRYEQTGIVEYVPAQSATDPAAAMPMAIDFYESPTEEPFPSGRTASRSWRGQSGSTSTPSRSPPAYVYQRSSCTARTPPSPMAPAASTPI